MEKDLYKKIFIPAEKLFCRTPFAEQLFAVHLFVKHVSMAN